MGEARDRGLKEAPEMTIKVNGEAIPEEAVEYEFQRLVKFYSGHLGAEQLRGQLDALRQKAREQAVGVKLLIGEAARLDLPVGDEEVEERYRKMEAGAGGPGRFEGILAQQGLTPDLVRQNIRTGRKVDKLVEKIVAGIPDPTEDELRGHFEAHAGQYRVPEQAEVRHILIKSHSERGEDRDVARSTLLGIRDRIAGGADFAELAAAHSQCPSGRQSGGSLGWVVRGSLVPAIDKAVFSMRVGELSEIIETKLGFHLVNKLAEQPARPAEFVEVRDRILEFLRHARRGEAITAYVGELKEKALIEES
jgi:peptidyl-prolyl cis-trans isomerase C